VHTGRLSRRWWRGQAVAIPVKVKVEVGMVEEQVETEVVTGVEIPVRSRWRRWSWSRRRWWSRRIA
jgi:hypothetical protein